MKDSIDYKKAFEALAASFWRSSSGEIHFTLREDRPLDAEFPEAALYLQQNPHLLDADYTA